MNDLGKAKKILGMNIDRDRNKRWLKLHQKPYLEKLTAKFYSLSCKSVQIPIAAHFALSKAQCPKNESELIRMQSVPYANVIGSIMYAMISTRSDLSYAVSLLSRYMSNPGLEHWHALKYVLAYISGTLSVGLVYGNKMHVPDLIGYVDADFASDRDSRKSNTAYVFTFGTNCISKKSQLQPLVALSTTESEYIAICDACKEAVWLQGLLFEAKLIDKCTVIYSDSQSAIHLSKNPVYHERTKHIEVKYHYIRELLNSGIIALLKVPTADNPADMGTNVVTNLKLKHCLRLLCIE
ncbi:unnamed protein product [Rhodiola kirilowii]